MERWKKLEQNNTEKYEINDIYKRAGPFYNSLINKFNAYSLISPSPSTQVDALVAA